MLDEMGMGMAMVMAMPKAMHGRAREMGAVHGLYQDGCCHSQRWSPDRFKEFLRAHTSTSKVIVYICSHMPQCRHCDARVMDGLRMCSPGRPPVW